MSTPLSSHELASAISAHIEQAAYLAPNELVPDEPLFSAGIIDSMNLLNLVTFVEKMCTLRVPPQDISLENWDSVERICAYIARRTGG